MSEEAGVQTRSRAMRSRSKDPAPAVANGHPRSRRNEKGGAMDAVPEDELSVPLTPASSQKSSSQRSVASSQMNGINGVNGEHSMTNGSSQASEGVHSRPLSPSTRAHEKEELQTLNHRLLTVLTSRADLEKQVVVLKERIAFLEKGQDETLEASLTILRDEVEKLRAALDQEAGQKAAVTVDAAKKEKDIKTFQNMLAQEKSRNAEMKKEVERVRAQEADMKDYLNRLNEATDLIRRLEEQLADSELQKRELEKSLEDENRERLELTNSMNTVVERARLEEKLSHEKLKRMSMPAMDVPDSGTFTVDREMVERLKEQYEDELDAQQERIAAGYEREVSSLKSQLMLLEDQLQAYKDMASASSKSQKEHQKENKDLRREIDRLGSALRDLQTEYEAYAARAKDKQIETSDRTRELREKYQQLFSENRLLIEGEGQLKAELAVYRDLIAEEEKRLSISSPLPNRPSRNGSKRHYDSPSFDSGGFGRPAVKKQRSDVLTPRPNSSTKYSVTKRTNKAVAMGPVRILEVEPGKVVRVENTSDAIMSLSGWKIIQDSQNSSVQYEFEEGASIGPKSVISVFSAAGNADTTTDDLSQRISDQSWLDGRSLRTVLQDADGNVLADHETTADVDTPNSDQESSPSSSRWQWLNPFRSANKESNNA